MNNPKNKSGDAGGMTERTEQPPDDLDANPDVELWNLDATFTDYILPRLKRFKAMPRARSGHVFDKQPENVLLRTLKKILVPQGNIGLYHMMDGDFWYPSDAAVRDEWEKILDAMIAGFEAHRIRLANPNFDHRAEKANREKITRGMQLFAQHYMELWE